MYNNLMKKNSDFKFDGFKEDVFSLGLTMV